MKILSNFKDYYDYVANIYGGGDPKIIYNRPHKMKNIPELLIEENHSSRLKSKINNDPFLNLCELFDKFNYGNYKSDDIITEVRAIVVGDILFTQVKEEKDPYYRLLTEEDISIINKRNKLFYFSLRDKLYLKYFMNHRYKKFIEVSRIIKIPVYSFNIFPNKYDERFMINDICPNLGNIGIASMIEATQMYQHLSYFIGNIMHDSPDTSKIPPMSNKTKIIAGGFDLKTSFRKMKDNNER